MNDQGYWVKLADVAEHIRDGTHGSFARVANGTPLLSAKNISDSGHVVVGPDESCVSEADARVIRRAFPVRAGDVLLTIVGSIGRVALVVGQEHEACFQRSVAGIRPKASAIESSFLAHYLRSAPAQRELVRRANSTAQAGVYLSELHRFPVWLPPLPMQKRIAAILDEVDRSISSTERLIAKRTHLMQGILGSVVYSRVDPNSGDWTYSLLGDLLADRPRNGYSPTPVDQATGVFVLGLGCITDAGFRASQLKNAPVSCKSMSQKLLVDGDLLITRANTRSAVGFVGIYRDVGAPCIYPDLVMRLTPRSGVYSEFLEIALRSPAVRAQIEALASGTSESMVKISASIVSGLRLRLPDLREQSRVVAQIQDFRKTIDLAGSELVKLRNLKQALMNDLLMGVYSRAAS